MEWSKIKTIVIWMLVITNLFLLGLVVQEEGKAQRLEREALENTIVFLNQRGIQLDADVVPDRMELVPQQAERALEREQSLAEALPLLDQKVRGYAAPDAVLTAVESRSSCPLRILRDEAGQSPVRGLWPCGEGAGYAGGILSAAADGLRTAESVLETL